MPATTNTPPGGCQLPATCHGCCIGWRPGRGTSWRISLMDFLHGPPHHSGSFGGVIRRGAGRCGQTTMAIRCRLVTLRRHQKLRIAAPRHDHRRLCLLRDWRRRLGQQISPDQCWGYTPFGDSTSPGLPAASPTPEESRASPGSGTHAENASSAGGAGGANRPKLWGRIGEC